MVEDSGNNLEEIGTAAHLMMEAVDKASQELETTVKSCTERLQFFSETLSNNFASQLTRLTDKALRADSRSSAELQARKEDFAERLAELEQSEINRLFQASKEVRQEINVSLQRAVTVISQLVEEQAKTLLPIARSRHESFANLCKTETVSMQQFVADGKSRLSEKESGFEKNLSQKVGDFESAAKNILEETKEKLSEKIKIDLEDLGEKVSQSKAELRKFISSSDDELEQKVKAGSLSLTAAGSRVTKRLVDQVDNWRQEMTRLSENFHQGLNAEKDSFDQIHTDRTERQVQEIKSEIKAIAAEAQYRLSASHKLFHGSLERLEGKYYERLERLLTQFEAAVAQENRILAGISAIRSESQASHELKDLLNTRLKARGLEIVKAFKRQVELFDLEHARYSASCNERIEGVCASANDLLEQQCKAMNTEVERALRGFRVELAQLNLQLPQIKDAGHAAALAVMAYKRARMSI